MPIPRGNPARDRRVLDGEEGHRQDRNFHSPWGDPPWTPLSPHQFKSSYQLFRRRGSYPASRISDSIFPASSRNVVPALLTTFSSIMTEPKSFAPYLRAIWPI